MCVCVQGVSLAQAKEKGQLVFLEGLKESLSLLIPQETEAESQAESQAMGFLRYTHTHRHTHGRPGNRPQLQACTVLPFSGLCCVSRDPAVGLCSLYEFIRSSLSGSGDGGAGPEEAWGPPVLLVDDLSVLLSLGVSVGAALDFSHYCRATVCCELQVWPVKRH